MYAWDQCAVEHALGKVEQAATVRLRVRGCCRGLLMCLLSAGVR
jgi:hypothetical protein